MSTVMEEDHQQQQQQPCDGAGSNTSVKGLRQEHQQPQGNAYPSLGLNFNSRQKTLITKKKPKKKLSLSAMDDGISFQETMAESCSCPVCGKTFSSKKAMFGHMRCHSDKERRERRYAIIKSDYVSKRKRESPETDVTLKKRRIGDMKEPLSEDDIRSMFRPWSEERKAEFLHQLVNNNSVEEEEEEEFPQQAPENAEFQSGSDDKKTNHVDSSESTEYCNVEDKSIVGNSNSDAIMPDNDLGNHSTPVRTAEEVDQADTNATEEELKFKCSKCNKAFRTHQALGGHKSSHYKSAKQASETKVTKDGPAKSVTKKSEVLEEKLHRPAPKLAQTVGSHKCEICGKTYAKGQSLGGHKRLHWVKPLVNTPTASPEVAPQQNDHSQTACRKVFDIDLNEQPVTEEKPKMTLLPLFVQQVCKNPF